MWQRFRVEWRFLQALTGVNLASAMEYRASFISQILGMFVNNGIYFVFWLLFFDRFGTVRGYGVRDVFLLFGVIALAFGMSAAVTGNVGVHLARIIAQGRLDYYLVFPRNLLSHVIFSKMQVVALGDIAFGLFAFLFVGRRAPLDFALFLLSAVLAAAIFSAFGVLAGSLAFFMGNAEYASAQATNAVLTFSMYPNTLFTGGVRLLLYTLVPAGFVGAMPVNVVKTHAWAQLGYMVLAVAAFWTLAVAVFYAGLRRYESGSAINVNM